MSAGGNFSLWNMKCWWGSLAWAIEGTKKVCTRKPKRSRPLGRARVCLTGCIGTTCACASENGAAKLLIDKRRLTKQSNHRWGADCVMGWKFLIRYRQVQKKSTAVNSHDKRRQKLSTLLSSRLEYKVFAAPCKWPSLLRTWHPFSKAPVTQLLRFSIEISSTWDLKRVFSKVLTKCYASYVPLFW